MSKEKIVVEIDSMDGSLSHYKIKTDVKTGNNIKVDLHRDNSNEWMEHYRGEKLMSLHDDGEGVNVKLLDDGTVTNLTLSYSQVEELHAVLTFYNKRFSNGFISKFRFFKEI